MPDIAVTLPSLHPGQLEVHNHPARFKVLSCGRRWGKTRYAAGACVETALSGKRGWWIGPTYKHTIVGWREMKELALQLGGLAEIRESDRAIRFPSVSSRAECVVRSADDPNSLRGDSVDLAVLDECAYMMREAWYEALRPALADSIGKALLISTPKGRNWFHDEFTRGRDPEEPSYASFTFPSWTNPYFPAQEWIDAKRTLPSDVFRQEFQAEFLEDGAGVFRGLEAVMRSERCRCKGPWLLGLDVARVHDFTVGIKMCKLCGDCHDMFRYNGVPWNVQMDRVEAYARENRCHIYVDATGLGDPIYDDLKTRGLRVTGVKLASKSKPKYIQRLQSDIEHQEVSYPPEWVVLTDELRRYEYKMTPMGNITYGAPQGYHDDCVIAFSLCASGRRRSRAWVKA